MSIFSKLFGDQNEKILKNLQPMVEKVNSLESEFESFSNEKLREKTIEFKRRLKRGESLNDILPEAFAGVRETAKRTLHQRHFDVQLIGGVILHQGKIAEMKTGEGKTLAATLPVYLNALEGNGCHLVTVNDYLARRDTVWMGQIYHFLGFSIGCLNHDQAFLYDPNYRKPDEEKERTRDELGGFKVVEDFLRPVSRKEAYLADITYGTNNEFGFDYLRDSMVYDESEIAQRGFNFAIVDEVDSILIDEARTPLIISQPDTESTKMYEEFAKAVPLLKKNIDFNIDEKMKAVSLTEGGIERVEKMLGKTGLYESGQIRLIHHLEQAVKAQFLFKRDRDYIIKDGQVIIVDEFTGRLLPGRRFSEGLHQAIEAKEGTKVQQESRTLATITFQNYFRMYKKLAGMTGTAATSAEEFAKVYNLDVVIIPTNLPMIRRNLPDRIYRNEITKFKAVTKEIKKLHQKGQPVLVGTTSIEKNEYLGKLLSREGVPHQILNAKHHESEGAIIAQAGKLSSVTIATNIAGRGVDIILGGNPPDENEARKIKELGGLGIIGTERHEARRIDNQLRGRSGRQGDPGFSQFFVSLEDDIVRVFGGENLKGMLDRFNFPEDVPIENQMISRAIEKAQGKVEGYNFDIRKHLLDFDDVLNKQRTKIYQIRNEILRSQDLIPKVQKLIKNQIEKIVDFHTASNYIDDWNLEEVFEEIKAIFQAPDEIRQKLLSIKKANKEIQELRLEVKNYLFDSANSAIKRKREELGEDFNKIAKLVQLRVIDILWMEHLENMEALRDSVRLRAYGQIDPLVAYRTEGHKIFQNLLGNFERQVANTILKVGLAKPTTQNYAKSPSIPKSGGGVSTESREILTPKIHNLKPKKKPGRNDPCPCGSGKKYKKCCWPKYG